MKNNLKRSWQSQFKHNQQALENIERIQNFLITNPSHQQLIDFLNHWQHPSQLYIKDYLFKICMGLAIICIALGIFFNEGFFIFGIVIMFLGWFKQISHRQFDLIIQACEQRTLEQKHQLFHQDDTQTFQDFSIAEHPLFKLGNDENYIQNPMYGKWNIKQSQFPFMVFNYHYVNKLTNTDEDNNEVVDYSHHDLWGIVITQFPVKGMSISTKQKRACRLGVKWSTGDIQFDQKF